jgi:exodeoxyribonuclease VII large subunit
MSENARTIRETNALIRALVEQETLGYPFWTSGYVTRYFLSDFGHVYFDLTDDNHTISCIVREPIRGTLDFTINNGMDIEVLGTIRFYEKQARAEIEVESVRLLDRPTFVPDTNIIAQLEKKGLWPKNKRPLPQQINRIGLITSGHSDALHDFEDTYRKEHGKASKQLIDVRVQGQQAPREIADAINRLNNEKEVGVIVLIRGGGRVADLAVFNDYLIAEAICRSTIPVVTGIGHQRNETFADRVADVQEITPTAAAIRLARQSSPVSAQKQPTSWVTYVSIGIAVLAVLGLVVMVITRQ